MKTFKASIAAFADKAKDNAAGVVRQTCQEMAVRVVAGGGGAPGTPVDTGFARGSWQPSLNTPAVKAGQADPTAAQALSDIAQVAAQMQPGDTFYYLNNCSYIEQLENGHSQQAPIGMVAIVVAQAEQIAQDQIDRFKL